MAELKLRSIYDIMEVIAVNSQYICNVMLNEQINPDSYLPKLPAVKYLAGNGIQFDYPVTILVGENGTGKSTLLEAIAVAYGFNAEGGTVNFNFSTNATHSELYRHLTLSRRAFANDGFFLRAESLYNVASNIDEMDTILANAPPIIDSYGGVSLHEQSHGESFLAIVHNRFQGNGLYILDEPEAALSPMRILTLMAEIDRLVKADSQFIIATHSPMLMALPCAQVLELSDNGIRPVHYSDSEHFRIMKYFINNPEKILRDLLD